MTSTPRRDRRETPDDDRILDFGGFPGRWEILRTGEETRGEKLEMRFQIEATDGDAPPLHIHPEADEIYHVQSGTLEVDIDGDWRDVEAGETFTVPAGTPHRFRNRVDVEMVDVHEPALDFERFFRRMHRLVTEQGVTLPPRSFGSMVLLAMLFDEHEREVVSVNPPNWLMNGLASVGRPLGYKLPD